MDISLWGIIGLIIGVLATTWFGPLRISRLLLLIVIGGIGSISGGVIGYVLYGAKVEWFDFSVFSIALIATFLFIIMKRKILRWRNHLRENTQPTLLLPERSSMALGV